MKKILALLLALVMVLGLFAACGKTDAPATTEGSKDTTTQGSSDDGTTEAPKELRTLTFMGNAYNTFTEFQYVDYWKESFVIRQALKSLEEEKGIVCEFVTFNDEQYAQAAAAKIQAGIDLPDVFQRAGELSAQDLYEAGIAANLKDILDQYDEDNSVRTFWTAAIGGAISSFMDGDGNIFELPYLFNRRYISENPEFVITGDAPHLMTVRRDWVTAIGEEWNEVMTVDEVVDLLIKLRENDANGNGAEDEVLSTTLDDFSTGLEYGFGMTRGLIGVYQGDEKVTCNLYHENFPAYIEALQKLYNAGCMDLSVAEADITTALVYSNRGMTQNGYACPWWVEGNIAGYETTADYQAIFIDEDKDLSTGFFCARDGAAVCYGGPSVNAEADLEAVADWMDWFYTEKIADICAYGIEGFNWEYTASGEKLGGVEGWTYDIVDGKRVSRTYENDEEKWAAQEARLTELGYTQEDWGDIRAAGNGMQSCITANAWPQIRWYNDSYDNTLASLQASEAKGQPGYWGYYETMVTDGKYQQYAKSQIAGAGEWAKATAEENEKWNEVATTVNTYISELIMGLVTGQKSIDDLQTYIDEVNALGLSDMVAIRQAQYDRYVAAGKG